MGISRRDDHSNVSKINEQVMFDKPPMIQDLIVYNSILLFIVLNLRMLVRYQIRLHIMNRRILLYITVFIIHVTAIAQPRETILLNENWNFLLAESELAEIIGDSRWEQVSIPHTWNNLDIQSGEKVNYGTAWYQKNIAITESLDGHNYFLRFEGVGQYAKVYVNEQFAGDHLGSYSAFTINITRFLKADTLNSVLVMVNNELTNSYPKDNFLFGIYGGIYRDVSLIITDDLHISLSDHGSSGVFVEQKLVSSEKARLSITTLLKNETSLRKQIRLVHKLMDGEKMVGEVSTAYELYPGGATPLVCELEIANPHLWHGKKDPFLYELSSEIYCNGIIKDSNSEVIGLRTFSIDENQGFVLNDEPYRLYGVCRHQEWENLGNALLPEHHRRDMELMLEVGATSIRLAHYQQADYIYHLADSIGFLIWAEIPFVNGYKEGADENAKQQLMELIKQNFNSPSIFVWGVHNEVIKGDVIQESVNLTQELHDLAKTLDPSRLTVSVSNIWWVYDHPIHELSDLQGFNQYTGWYGGKPNELRNWIKNYHAKKPDVRFSVSEYGAGGNVAHQTSDIQTIPPPKSQFFPESYHTYHNEETWAAIEDAPFIWASYVWNMFDFSVPEWDRGGVKGRNHKGLITYDREIKKDAFYWYKANWSEEAVFFLAGKRNNKIREDSVLIKVYSNVGVPQLQINRKSSGLMEKGINDVQYTKKLALKQGVNKIKISTSKGNLRFRDECRLTRVISVDK